MPQQEADDMEFDTIRALIHEHGLAEAERLARLRAPEPEPPRKRGGR